MNCNHASAFKAVVLFFLLALTFQTAQGQLSVKDPPKAQNAVRIGIPIPRVTISGGGPVGQEANSLRQNLRSYLRGPKIGTIDLVAKLDSLALEEGEERQCDYVLFVSLRRTPQLRTGSYSKGTKVGDEFVLEYKLVSTDTAQTVASNVHKARANSDGQDVLTPIVETIAQSIVDLTRATASSSTPATENNTQNNAEGVLPKSSSNRTPKSDQTIRLGLLTPRVTYTGGGGHAGNEATLIRKEIESYLEGTNIETVDIQSRLESFAVAESRKRECDYLLAIAVTRKRNAGGKDLRSIVGSAAGSEISRLPGGNKAGQVARGATAIATFLKANDEFIFEYKVIATATESMVITNTLKEKVKSDGENVLTPIIETTARELIEALKTKSPND